MSHTPKNIKVPKQLGTAVMDQRGGRRCASLLLYLIHYCDAGRYEVTNENIRHYSECARVSVGTFRNWMDELTRLKLAWRKGNWQYFAGWDKIIEHFNLPKRTRWYYIAPPTGKAKLHDILRAIGIKEKLKECTDAFEYNLSKHPDIKETILRVAGSINRDVVHNCQWRMFLDKYRSMDKADVYELNAFRADNNLSYRSWSELFGYSSQGGFVYMKRKLQALGLITVNKRSYDLIHHKRGDNRKSMLGTTYYKRPDKMPTLTLPDEIIINSLNTVVPVAA